MRSDCTPRSVPHFPEEDSKLRATSLQTRRGGNGPNTLEVLQQLLRREERGRAITPYLISCLPSADSPATNRIHQSFGPDALVNLTRCIYRPGENPASSYIIRSEETGSRTVVNYSDLADMTVDEFVEAVSDIGEDAWFHFEVRRYLPTETGQPDRCLQPDCRAAPRRRRYGAYST